jgi:O-Antigen ligase
MLSMVLFSLPATLVFAISAARRIAPQVWLFAFGAAVGLMWFAVLALSDIDIEFANDSYTLADLLLKPLSGILSLESSGEEWGSLNNRTDAAIFVIIEYLRTLGFGLGAGGSWLVLTQPQYLLGGAQSPHNALLQFIVDFGYPVLLGYGWLLVWAMRRLFVYKLGEYDRLRVIAIVSFPMLGLSQSGAIVTNYFFFAAIFFIGMLARPAMVPLLHSAPYVRRCSVSSSTTASSGAVRGAPS